jgi:hypothetical protein
MTGSRFCAAQLAQHSVLSFQILDDNRLRRLIQPASIKTRNASGESLKFTREV